MLDHFEHPAFDARIEMDRFSLFIKHFETVGFFFIFCNEVNIHVKVTLVLKVLQDIVSSCPTISSTLKSLLWIREVKVNYGFQN